MLDLLRNLEDRFSHIIISDSEDDIDVVTVDESADKLVKTPGELITPIGKQNKVQNFTYILNRPNDSVSVKLSATEVAAILETPAKRKRLNRTLDGIDNVFINAVNCARMTGYHPLHDHNYCTPSIIQTEISPYEWNSNRKQLKKKCYMKSTEYVRDDKAHNILERKRTKDLRERYQRLRKMIPERKGKSTATKVAILKEACRYIADLQEEFSYKARHLRELQLENRSLSVSLNDLKRIYLKEGL